MWCGLRLRYHCDRLHPFPVSSQLSLQDTIPVGLDLGGEGGRSPSLGGKGWMGGLGFHETTGVGLRLLQIDVREGVVTQSHLGSSALGVFLPPTSPRLPLGSPTYLNPGKGEQITNVRAKLG